MTTYTEVTQTEWLRSVEQCDAQANEMSLYSDNLILYFTAVHLEHSKVSFEKQRPSGYFLSNWVTGDVR